ncbi:hypothetical protein RND81_06G096200 [Saponaria officinalis]|uniref:Uncharacterized protein n=1 Tax=Saponaria officinalis TaxID=3572 RepID=A0AAW1K9Y8_SAPOF
MIRKVLQRTLTGHNSLNKEPEHGKHSQPSILDLLHLQLRKSFRILSQPQGVKTTTWVKRVNHLTKGPTSDTVTLNCAHQNNLTSPNGQDTLSMDQTRVTQVVKTTLAKDL